MRLRFVIFVVLLALLGRRATAQVSDAGTRAPGATVSGVVRDSIARLPLVGAWVQLVPADGQAHAARTVVADSLGRFAIDDVPDGRYTLGFMHPLLDSLGLEPPLRAVRVRRHRPVRADLAIPSPAQLSATICGPRPVNAAGLRGVVLGVVRGERDHAPVAGVTVIGEWGELTLGKGGIETLRMRIVATTAKSGWYSLCNVPRGGLMSLSVSQAADSAQRLDVRVPATGLLRADLYVVVTQAVVGVDTLRLGLVRGPAAVLTDSAIRAKVDSATREFLLLWRYAWQTTQNGGQPLLSGEPVRRDLLKGNEVRNQALHCHWIETPSAIRRHVIADTMPAHATCPMWYSPEGPTLDDERHGIDGGLHPAQREGIQALRSQLRTLLDTSAQHLSGDASIAGQRVRFALDAGDLAGASAAAAACTRDLSRCALLRALVLHRSGDIAGADSAFLAAASLMDDDERCAWNDVGVLLDMNARRAYGTMTCAARADLEARLWWLADPLFLEAGNERRAEHFARRTLVTLLAPLGDDGRQRWEQKKGGKAVAESLVRYGWPSQMFWGGPEADRGHDAWLIAHGADTAPPYPVREYTTGRLHTVPLSGALQSPFRAKPDDWQLNAPASEVDWWPIEHFARDMGGIVQLPIGQTVMLRRRNSIRFLWAGDLDAAVLGRPAGDNVHATFFMSRSAADIVRVGTSAGRVGQPLVVDRPLLPGAAIIGVEVPGDRVRAAARSRFGVETPKPLSALGGGVALSQPMLFEPAADFRGVLDADAVARRMYGTTTFTKWRRIGIYWESYGFAASDAVEIEVRMTREDRPGVFARIVGFFVLGREEGGTVILRWPEEPGSGAAVHRREGSVPVQMRSITLDISRLTRGTYRLQLLMNRAGSPAAAAEVSSERMFVLR